jgi:hypothetical protein
MTQQRYQHPIHAIAISHPIDYNQTKTTHLESEVQSDLSTRQIREQAPVHCWVHNLRKLHEHQLPDVREAETDVIHRIRQRKRLEVACVVNLSGLIVRRRRGLDERVIGGCWVRDELVCGYRVGATYWS